MRQVSLEQDGKFGFEYIEVPVSLQTENIQGAVGHIQRRKKSGVEPWEGGSVVGEVVPYETVKKVIKGVPGW